VVFEFFGSVYLFVKMSLGSSFSLDPFSFQTQLIAKDFPGTLSAKSGVFSAAFLPAVAWGD